MRKGTGHLSEKSIFLYFKLFFFVQEVTKIGILKVQFLT
jgi:hypothetical protein